MHGKLPSIANSHQITFLAMSLFKLSLFLSGSKGVLLMYEYTVGSRKFGAGPPCRIDITINSPTVQN